MDTELFFGEHYVGAIISVFVVLFHFIDTLELSIHRDENFYWKFIFFMVVFVALLCIALSTKLNPADRAIYLVEMSIAIMWALIVTSVSAAICQFLPERFRNLDFIVSLKASKLFNVLKPFSLAILLLWSVMEIAASVMSSLGW